MKRISTPPYWAGIASALPRKSRSTIVVEPNNLGEDEQIQQLQVGQYPHIQMITSWFYYRCLQSADVLLLGSSHLSFTAQEADRHFDGEPDR